MGVMKYMLKSGLKKLKPDSKEDAMAIRTVRAKVYNDMKKEGVPEAVLLKAKKDLRKAEAAVAKFTGSSSTSPLTTFGGKKRKMATKHQTTAKGQKLNIDTDLKAKQDRLEAMDETSATNLEIKRLQAKRRLVKKGSAVNVNAEKQQKKVGTVGGRDFVAKGFKKEQSAKKSKKALTKAQIKRRKETAEREYKEVHKLHKAESRGEADEKLNRLYEKDKK